MPAKKVGTLKKATKKVTTAKKTTTKQYTAKVAIAPAHDPDGKGLSSGDKVSAKRAQEIAAGEGAKLSDLFT